ncbi:MAG: four helix bundle protein [Anaerolineae bacterium]|nr:four helix bundle protein [Anaerolineae bacterium]
MDYEEWERTVPETMTGDSLWKMKAYRLALFLSDVGWHDVTKLMRDRRTISLSDQLYRALGSISANLAEGYSRGTGKDRARFYEYSLGSARESRDWYYKGRHILGEAVVQHRLQLLTEVVRLLLTMVPQQRGRILREDSIPYETGPDNSQQDAATPWEKLDDLLRDIPLPTNEM